MKITARTLSISILSSLLAGAASGQPCVPTISPVDDVSVILLADVPEDTSRREFAEITDDLASMLGIAETDVDLDPEAPNPQIRVRVQTSPAGSEITSNNMIFTVTRLRPTPPGRPQLRLFIHRQEDSADKDSGEFKLLAKANGNLSPVSHSNALDMLEDFSVQIYSMPVSSSAFTSPAGVTTKTTFYCEPASAQSYLEKASREADDRIVAMAPHGGNIEAPTSSQAQRFATTLESLDSTPVNVWNLEGKWGNDQTFERWHATATSIDAASYPGLANLLPADGNFDHAVAFHGFGGSASATCVSGPFAGVSKPFFQIILGGGAPRNLKCAIAHALDDAMAAGSRQDAVAIALRDAGGNIAIADHCGRNVSQPGLDGTHDDNIVNRIAANGGIQLEQSKSLRSDAGLPDLVADAVADGYADFLANPLHNFCVAPY